MKRRNFSSIIEGSTEEQLKHRKFVKQELNFKKSYNDLKLELTKHKKVDKKAPIKPAAYFDEKVSLFSSIDLSNKNQELHNSSFHASTKVTNSNRQDFNI